VNLRRDDWIAIAVGAIAVGLAGFWLGAYGMTWVGPVLGVVLGLVLAWRIRGRPGPR
jgi:hypothetical protein